MEGQTVIIKNENQAEFESTNEPRPNTSRRGRKRKNENNSPDEFVTCAVCNAKLPERTWNYHKRTIHNNLTWKIGEDSLDLADQALVTRTLQALCKLKKSLNCYKCGTKKKSVVGYLSHQATCSKSEKEIEELKVVCGICGNSMLPVSLPAHMKLSHPDPEIKKTEKQSESTRVIEGKREAAKKAQGLIESMKKDELEESIESKAFKNYKFSKEDNTLVKLLKHEISVSEFTSCKFDTCSFESNEATTLLRHICSCVVLERDYFSCKICFKSYELPENLIDHYSENHSKQIKNMEEFVLSSDDASEDTPMETVCEKNKKPGTSRPKIQYPQFLKMHGRRPSAMSVFSPAVKWTRDFREKYYSTTNLFSSLKMKKNDWKQLHDDELEKYAPELDTSCSYFVKQVEGYGCKDIDEHLTTLDLFESSKHDQGRATVFCGGSVTCIAWAPTPDNSETCTNQILAVSVILNANKKFHVNKNYNDSGTIQIWNFGLLENGTDPSLRDPTLVYCICHDYGFISDMKWCPSGCYDRNRLGLLGIASSDSNVYVYAVPTPGALGSKKMIKGVPVLQLSLQENMDELSTLGKQECHATKLSWTQAEGHRFISVGYSNGMVSIFDLWTRANLLHIETSTKILPYLTFQAHTFNITVLHLHHLSGGHRWLLTGSSNREMKIWDLQNPSVHIYQSRKHTVNDGIWMTHWLSFVLGFEELPLRDGSSQVPINVVQMRDYQADPIFLAYCGATITSISENSWINGLIFSSSGGEILGSLPFQLFKYPHTDKSYKMRKFALSFTILTEKDDEGNDLDNSGIKEKSNSDPLTYEKVTEKYGLIFCDVEAEYGGASHVKNLEDMRASSQKQPTQKHNMYPLTAVNDVAFNPNKQSFLYFASGHQSGFLRLHYLKFKNLGCLL